MLSREFTNRAVNAIRAKMGVYVREVVEHEEAAWLHLGRGRRAIAAHARERVIGVNIEPVEEFIRKRSQSLGCVTLVQGHNRIPLDIAACIAEVQV